MAGEYDDMTFREAFASARGEKRDNFTWRGKRFSTAVASPKPGVTPTRNPSRTNTPNERAGGPNSARMTMGQQATDTPNERAGGPNSARMTMGQQATDTYVQSNDGSDTRDDYRDTSKPLSRAESARGADRVSRGAQSFAKGGMVTKWGHKISAKGKC